MIAQPSSNAGYGFRGDFGALAAMMQQSWAENPNQPLLYSEAYLRSAFDFPGSTFQLAPAIYGNTGILGFVAGFPRSVRWDGKPIRIVLSCFLTASTKVKGLGMGLRLWRALINRSREQGYDGVIGYCVEGDGMHKMLPDLSRLLQLDTQRIFSVEYLVRLLRSAPPAPIPKVTDADIDLFLELTSNLPGDLPLTRLWTRAEAEWQCRSRSGGITVTHSGGSRRGMITGYLTHAASQPPVPVALLDDLLWGDLEPSERSELLDNFLRIVAAQGARMVSCPVLGYSSLEPLEAGRFRRSKRVLHMYLTSWNQLQPRPLEALYIDVF
jgi:hypothetical protein